MRFYAVNFASYAVPRCWFRWRKVSVLSSLSDQERQEAEQRARYYCQMDTIGGKHEITGTDALTVGEFKYPWGQKHKFVTYFFDLYNVLKYFPIHLRFYRIFGDVNYVPNMPAFVKSRPIAHTPANGIILKLNQVRHFHFVHDKKCFADKQDRMVSRNFLSPNQPQRVLLMEHCFGSSLCDVGQINDTPYTGHPEWTVPYMSTEQMLDYKFIACIEGNDVATNLKWVMSSNSVAVMPRPKFETWFMEGTLRPDYHYIEVADDYHDVEEKLLHYIHHPEEAEEIVRHAHQYIEQFTNKRLERATQLLTAQRYFENTNT